MTANWDCPGSESAGAQRDSPEFHRKNTRWVFGLRRRMRELLALPAVDGEGRDYLLSLGVPPEKIDNSMLLVGMLFREALKANLRALQELECVVGDNETELDRKMKLAQWEKVREQTEDLRRRRTVLDDDADGGGSALAELMSESAASVWQDREERDSS